jgi:hypothetical protein
MKSARHGLIAILFSILVLPLSALAAPLSDLSDQFGVPIPGASISQGDKLFTNFSAVINAGGDAFPVGGDLAAIDVSGITVGARHGLSFRGSLFAHGGFGGNDGQVELFVGFDVTATDPRLRVHEVSLTLAGGTIGGNADVTASAGPASVGIVTFFDPFEDLFEFEFGPRTATRTFHRDANSVHVDTTIHLDAIFPGGVTSSGYDVLFAQSVAEPSIVRLLVGGAGLIAAIAHKVRRA